MTHICVSQLAIIGSDNGLSPGRRQAIIWTNAGILLIGPSGTNFSEILIGIQTFSFKKMHLKMSSAKYCQFRLGLNVLICPSEPPPLSSCTVQERQYWLHIMDCCPCLHYVIFLAMIMHCLVVHVINERRLFANGIGCWPKRHGQIHVLFSWCTFSPWAKLFLLLWFFSSKWKCRHFDEIFVIACTGSCHFVNTASV